MAEGKTGVSTGSIEESPRRRNRRARGRRRQEARWRRKAGPLTKRQVAPGDTDPFEGRS